MPMSRDIIAISIPFSAGVISAAYLPLGELSLYTAASLLCVAIFLCLIYICRRRNGLPGIILCLYLTGALVCFSSRMSADTDGAGWQLPRKTLESLTRLIESNICFHVVGAYLKFGNYGIVAAHREQHRSIGKTCYVAVVIPTAHLISIGKQ